MSGVGAQVFLASVFVFAGVVVSILQMPQALGRGIGIQCYRCYYYSGNGTSGDASCAWGNVPSDEHIIDCESEYAPSKPPASQIVHDDDDAPLISQADLPSHCSTNDFQEPRPYPSSFLKGHTKYGCVTLHGEDTNGETLTTRNCVITFGLDLAPHISPLTRLKREWRQLGRKGQKGLAECVSTKFSGFTDQATIKLCNCKTDKCNNQEGAYKCNNQEGSSSSSSSVNSGAHLLVLHPLFACIAITITLCFFDLSSITQLW